MITRERPILFSGPMIRAILEGRKTQTRRVIVPQPAWRVAHGMVSAGWAWTKGKTLLEAFGDARGFALVLAPHCPHGVPGDRLWVRETWQICRDGLPNDGRPIGKDGLGCLYAATEEEACDWENPSLPIKWRPSIFMPRWVCRLLPELVAVRVERVQEITEEDAKAEGAECVLWHGDKAMQYENQMPVPTYRAGFANLWNTLNAKRGFGWDVNPFVWALTFRRLA